MSWDGFFSSDPEAVVHALSSLATSVTEQSHGEVTDAAIFRYANFPHRAGVLSEVIFGPRERFRCACGALVGSENAGKTCERCGVLSGEPSERNRRWGHIALASPCLHPRLFPLVAELLGASTEGVAAVAHGEAWCHAGEIFIPPGSEPKLEPGVPIWEWEPAAVEELDPGLQELYRVNAKLRRLGALPKWAEEHFGTEAAWFEEAIGGTGPSGLRAALASLATAKASAFEARFGIAPALLVSERLPVPPPGNRPYVPRPGGFEHPGPANLAFAHLVFLSGQLAQAYQYEAPGMTTREVERGLQLVFEEIVFRMTGQLPKWLAPAPVEPTLKVGGDPPRLEHFSNHEYDEEPDCNWFRKSIALVFAGDSALVQLPTATFPVRLADGSVGEPTLTVGLRLLAFAASHAVFFDPSHTGLHVLYVASRRWCNQKPEAFPASLLHVAKRWTGARLVVSACGRFYMETIYMPHSVYDSDGSVVRSLDGEPVFEPRGEWRDGPVSWMSEDGTVRVFDDPYEGAEECHPQSGVSAEALVLSESGEFLTLDDNVLLRGREVVCGLAFEIQAAAFDPTGSRLLLCGAKTLTLLDVREPPRVIGSFSLLPLFDQMATARWRGSTRALGSALCRYGSLSKIAERELGEIAELTMMDESWEIGPVGTAEAKRILRMARGARARNQPLLLPRISRRSA